MYRSTIKKVQIDHLIAALAGFGLLLWTTGCGQQEAQDFGEADQASADWSTPAVSIPEDAPVLEAVYPTLSDGVLQRARLTDLPDGTLLQADGVLLTENDLEQEFAQMDPGLRTQMEKNAFMMIEQMATMELLTSAARRKIDDPALEGDALLQAYFQELPQDVSVNDTEIAEFYEQNQNMMGGASLEQISPRIRDHLQQQKQQEAVESHIAQLGRKTTIAVDADWTEKQAAAALDNPVDQARASGKPTFVNFGSEGCRPCDMMIPIREELRTEYEDQLNVIFVPVNEERMLSSRYGVQGIPHLVFFDKDGKQVHTHTGFMPREQIEEWLTKIGVKIKG